MAGEHARRIDELDEPGIDSLEFPLPSEPVPDTEPAITKEFIADTQIAPTVAAGQARFESPAESGEYPVTRSEQPPTVIPISSPISKPISRDLPPYVSSVLHPTQEDDIASQRKQQEAA